MPDIFDSEMIHDIKNGIILPVYVKLSMFWTKMAKLLILLLSILLPLGGTYAELPDYLNNTFRSTDIPDKTSINS